MRLFSFLFGKCSYQSSFGFCKRQIVHCIVVLVPRAIGILHWFGITETIFASVTLLFGSLILLMSQIKSHGSFLGHSQWTK